MIKTYKIYACTRAIISEKVKSCLKNDLRGFSFYQNIENFEAFIWKLILSANCLFYWCRPPEIGSPKIQVNVFCQRPEQGFQSFRFPSAVAVAGVIQGPLIKL